MDLVILAAGRGSRLREKTASQPKCLTKMAGKSLLDWQFEAIHASKVISDTALVIGYQGAKLEAKSDHLIENPDWQHTNMLYSLYCAMPWILSRKESVLISYSDIVYTARTLQTIKSSAGDIVVPYNTEWQRLWESRFTDYRDDAESFSVDKTGRLTEIGQKITDGKIVNGQFMGFLKLSPNGKRVFMSALEKLSHEKIRKIDLTRFLQYLIDSNILITTIPITGDWYEVDSTSDLELYEEWITRGTSWIPRVTL